MIMLDTYLNRKYWYRLRKIALFALLFIIFYFSLNYWQERSQKPQIPAENESSVVLPEFSALPTALRIPSINLEAQFGPTLGVQSNGEIEVPESFDELGWYHHGPLPGNIGPAVILGHVDSFKGPAVLFNLGQVNVGDSIFITNKEGVEVEFVIEKLDRPSQSSFPTSEVYGDLDYPGLRLITCSGTYNRGIQRYTHNLIVYAKVVN